LYDTKNYIHSKPASNGTKRIIMSNHSNPMTCPRCEVELSYVGTKAFHEGTRWGVLGELGELFVNKQRFDVYVCPRCGRVELFIDGIGEEFRPH
jgi:ribosomal protein S27AE